MEIFLVGGAVRDRLLGKPVRDRDWVVVGATEDEMLRAGFTRVGADFPVFLHSETREEYALARTERKTAPGHRGFVTHAEPDVTLEEDLARRDLTINAIAQAEDGHLIDPFHGERDLRQGVLRAVTEAFREDPLRILRVARFAAQLPGFVVAPETLEMMRGMCTDGAMQQLPGERVWGELSKVLASPHPRRFFDVVEAAGAWLPFFAELEGKVLIDLPAGDELQRFAAWMERLPESAIRSFCERNKVPNAYRNFALSVVRHGDVLQCWQVRPPRDVVGAVAACKGFHDADNLRPILRYLALRHGSRPDLLLAAVATANRTVSPAHYPQTGKALGDALFEARAEVLRKAQG